MSPSLSMSLLGGGVGQQKFYVQEDFWASSTIPREGQARSVSVPVKSLNDEVRRIDPTVLVIDIEGGELELSEIIDFHHVEKVCMEMHEWAIGRDKVECVREKFVKAGFVLDQALSTETVWFLERARRMNHGER